MAARKAQPTNQGSSSVWKESQGVQKAEKEESCQRMTSWGGIQKEVPPNGQKKINQTKGTNLPAEKKQE